MNVRRASASRPLLVLALAVLAANAVVFAAFTWPGLTRARRAEARAREVAARKATLEELWARVTRRREVAAANRSDIEKLTRDLLKPRATDLFAAQREIETLARESGLKPERTSYEVNPVAGTGLVRCEVTLPLNGSYGDLTTFLGRVERGKRFLIVDQLSLAEEEKGARMTLRLSALFRGESAP